MTDAEMSGEVLEAEQIRISLVLSKTCADKSLEVPSDPIAVPSTTRKKGLSAIVNHLLNRKVTADKSESDEDDEDSDSDDEDKLPAIPFDFLLNNKLLRMSVEGGARKEALSLEKAVEIHYFPARLAPQGDGESESMPDWISAMSYTQNMLYAGSCDGSIRSFRNDGEGSILQEDVVKAHSGPIKCLSSCSINDSIMIASGSMDQTLLTHVKNGDGNLALHAVYTGGHATSINSVRLSSINNSMASGDWEGGLCIWKVPSFGGADAGDATERKSKKQKKSSKKKSSTEQEVREVSPLVYFKAHAGTISGIEWGYESSQNLNTMFTSSWDHSIRSWDIETQNSIMTLNGSKVVTCMGRCSNSNVVASGHPDCSVRLWDMRTSNEGGEGNVFNGSLRPSHKEWVSGVEWSPKDPFVLASTSHDGSVKVWDIRSSLPLHTVRAHKKGQKALCLAFTDGTIFSGGSDCIVKRFKY